MQAKRHPWLEERFAPVASLPDAPRIWTFLAGHTASGDLDQVARDWSYLPPEAHASGLEIILQTHLFAGYPRAINALAAVHRVGVGEGTAYLEKGPEPEAWIVDGERLCRRIYGAAYEKLRARMQVLHPDLDRWMVEIGYGRVLSRPGPSLRERELCVLAVLSGQQVPPQLTSHLQGAIHAGATLEECRAILGQTQAIWGAKAQEAVDAVWESFLARDRSA